MKRIIEKICVVLLLGILASLEVSVAHSTVSTAQDRALAFIENALPIDNSRYNITLKNYGVTQLPPDLGQNQNVVDVNGEEVLTYSLKSEKSTVQVICTIRNNVVCHCMVDVMNGSIISDRPYVSMVDAANGFLKKYQTYSGIDSTEMVKMLSNVDSAKNGTMTSGNLKLTTNHIDASNTVFSNTTDFRWVRTFNGCDYLALDVAFKNGMFYSLIDQRAVYSIGDTAVNVSKEQAISIAMKYISNYSYTMPGGVEISGFKVTEDRTVAQLVAGLRTPNVLYPYWSVILYLNQTYPGSIYGFAVDIWADSGKIWGCYNQGAGGYVQPNNSTVGSTEWYVQVEGTAVAIVIVIAVIAVIVKKKSR